MSACNRIKSDRFPYKWDLNIYRGCEHGCRYCYALYSHRYLDGEFHKSIYIKDDILEGLERQLSSPRWKGEIINIGGVTDSYQPIERERKLMPEVLKLLIRYRTPCIISTKSNLILRDFHLIEELSRKTYVNIASSIISADDDFIEKMEPGAALYRERVEVLKRFSIPGISTGLHLMPIIPQLSDSVENLERVIKMGSEINVTYLLPGILYLRGDTRRQFFKALDHYYPLKSPTIKKLYKGGGLEKSVKREIHQRVYTLMKRFKVSADYQSYIERRLNKQPQLF